MARFQSSSPCTSFEREPRTRVLVRDRPSEKAGFHRFSIVVWSIWLVPYFTGAIGAMTA
ncbi:hypothetical protein [Rhodococcus spelaei]|uniref:hypothetical protein n=1 Tax=Rhodococcus spelaei TaxID=2546320 RepID=UPI0015EF05ED|nr:hypothetical protein [Rhodococcus spelaei]